MSEQMEVVVEQTQDTVQERRSWLDRPLIPALGLNGWLVIYLLLVAFIVFTRLWNLAPRAYSHDESIHAWESWKLLTGQGYVHSPIYHGPLLYHVTAFIYALFGDNDYTGRLATSLMGIGMVVAPFFLQKWLGKKGLLAATLLMAVSPVMMHRSRFIRHDQGAVLFNMILLIGILHYLDERKAKYLYWIAAALSLSMAGKETTFITFAIFGSFVGGVLLWDWFQSDDRTLDGLMRPASFDLIIVIGTLILPFASPLPITLLGRSPIDYSPSGLLFSFGITLVMFGIGAGIGLWWHPRRWLICAALFWGLFVPLFTTMFTNGNGLATGVVGQLGYWLSQHGVARGGQPWFYYIVLTSLYEFLPLLLALGAMALYFFRGDPRERAEAHAGRRPVPFVPMMIFWTVGALVMYSWAGEKMPWLMMHIALPMQILGGWLLGRLLDADWRAIREQGGLWLLLVIPLFLFALIRLLSIRPFSGTTVGALSDTILWLSIALVGAILTVGIARLVGRLGRRNSWRMVALSLVGVLLALTLRFAWMATFIHADSVAELLVYAQGAPDAGIIARELDAMSHRLTGGLHMQVAYDNQTSWPFVWYLRNYENAIFFGEAPGAPLDAEVVLVGVGNEAGVVPFLGNEYIRRQHRLVWWPYQDWYNNMANSAFWRDLANPEARNALWQVLFYRQWDRSLAEWPYVSNFAMYVRRDVVQSLWDAGPEALASLGPMPQDDYVDRWILHEATTAWGSPGSGSGQFNAPKGVAVDAEGYLYIADSQNHRIQVLDSAGNFVDAWGSEGAEVGQFSEPWGVAVSPDQRIYVADTWNHRVQVFERDGTFVRAWGVFGQIETDLEQDGAFYGPRDLTFDAEGNLYLTDTGNKRILKYDAAGQLVAVVGGVGGEAGQFQEPVGVAAAPDGRLYVADTWNRRIQVFDDQLAFEDQWEVSAWGAVSVMNKPYLAVDAQGTVWATDPEGYRLLAFSDESELLAVIGRRGSDLSGMNLPTGIASDPQGRLLVSDSENHRVLVFDALELPDPAAVEE